MHAHMIDFKKIGSYLRIKKLKNGPVPEYDLKPNSISIKRKLIEYIIGLVLYPQKINQIIFFLTQILWAHFSNL